MRCCELDIVHECACSVVWRLDDVHKVITNVPTSHISIHTYSITKGPKHENGRIPEKHALSTGASREAPVDNARLTLGT